MDEQLAHLEKIGIEAAQHSSNDEVKPVMIKDPDGNSIAFAEPADPGMTR